MMLALVLLAVSSPNAHAQNRKPSQAEMDAWARADANADGQLDKSEFIVFVKAMAEAGQKTAQRVRFLRAYGYAFSVADSNRDGVLSPAEMRAAENGQRARQ